MAIGAISRAGLAGEAAIQNPAGGIDDRPALIEAEVG
jgi:hypothetical protein